MGFNFNDCKTVPTNKTTEADGMMTGYGKDSGGESWKPNAATLATLHEQQQKLQSCQSGYIQQAMKKYSNMPVTKKVLEQGGANGMYVTSKEGILGQVRCSLFFFNRKLCWFFWRYFGCEKSDTFSYDFHLLSPLFISFHLLLPPSTFIYFHLLSSAFMYFHVLSCTFSDFRIPDGDINYLVSCIFMYFHGLS